MANVWLLQAFGEERQYAGNLGYEDDPRRVYRYDSFVPNSRNLAEGDLAVLRGPDSAIGVARLERITEERGTKTRNRCPICRDSGIKERMTLQPRYRCNNKHEFDIPSSEQAPCTKYAVHFGVSFIAVGERVDASNWRVTSENYNGQLAMQQVDRARLQGRAFSKIKLALDALEMIPPALLPEDSVVAPDYAPSDVDERTIVIQQIRARRGQQAFRRALLHKYDHRCVISGCRIVDLLEAAHISPYRGPNDHHPDNGLLLRADLHTLFDLNLLGLEPESLVVRLHPMVLSDGYREFDAIAASAQSLSREALESRWARFQTRLTEAPR